MTTLFKDLPMRMITKLFFSAALLGTVACGGDGGTGPSNPTYESVAATYTGGMSGVSQGVALNATFTLTLVQSQASLSGTYGLDGALSDGFDVVGVAGSGTITGTIGSGTNPSINLTIRSSVCANYTATFSGTYDSANRRITMQGPVEFFGAGGCNVVLSYPMNVVLQR
jgi:hypothetical protein